ncbi:MAG: XdhC family protein [Proteobacteria bacterium]|nr:XdhC family protein [Pseudomonadota bacterium]
MDLYGTIEQYIKNGQKGVLATVIYRAGSAPRDIGTKMFIGDDGKCFGTVGGGRLEFDAHREAMRIMETGGMNVIHFRMNSKEVAEDGMLCGGNVDILLEPVKEKYLELYRKIGNLLQKRGKGVVVTVFDGNNIRKTLIEQDAGTTGDILEEREMQKFYKYIHENQPAVIDGVIVEPLKVFSSLYIFGAGHVSQFISKIAKIVDFYVVVIDDREEFANREKFPEADEIIVEDFHTMFEKLKFTGQEFVTIVTRGHKYDADVLAEALKKPLKYTGMIGSKRKVKIVFDFMRESGFSEEAIGKVYAPIGLSIGAETPQEIAVSIVAELIKIRGEH